MGIESDPRYRAYRFVAVGAIFFSLLAVLCAAISLPMAYRHVKRVRTSLHSQMLDCRVSLIFFPPLETYPNANQ